MNNSGWICPKCGNVYSPYVTECTRCNYKDITNATDVALNDYYKYKLDMEAKYNAENDNK